MTDIKTFKTILEHATLMRELLKPGVLEDLEKKVGSLSAAEQTRVNTVTKAIADAAAAQEAGKVRQKQLDEHAAELAALKDKLEKTDTAHATEDARLSVLKAQLDTVKAVQDKKEQELLKLKADLDTRNDSLHIIAADLETSKADLAKDKADLETRVIAVNTFEAKLKARAANLREQTSDI